MEGEAIYSEYAILYHPGHNRVYFEASLKLSAAEFGIAASLFTVKCENIRNESMQGVDYLTFRTDGALSREDIRIISGLSFIYALFTLEEIGGRRYFYPVDLSKEDFIDESMGMILKYSGKTNEAFTRLMINVAYYTLNGRGAVRLLDPLAGKGTTLYEGLVKGHHVYGVEINDTAVNEAYHYIKRFLEEARYKYTYKHLRLSGANRSYSALRHSFTIAKGKEQAKSKDTRTIELIAGDARYANAYYKKGFFDLIVGDLPYGIQHGNVVNPQRGQARGQGQAPRTRNPMDLLKTCLPSWMEVLRPMGVIALAWNTHVLPREQMEQLFAEQGCNVICDGDYAQFAHRVDQSIVRDILVAQKR